MAANLYILEIRGPNPKQAGGDVSPLDNAVDQKVASAGSSVQSNAFKSGTVSVILSADAVCNIAYGTNPTATANNWRLPANLTIQLAVTPGNKIAVIG